MAGRSSYRAYGALVALRVLLTLAPGYVHPDEFFQWMEPVASLTGFNAALPWEFDASLPLRSWLPPAAFSGPMLLLLRRYFGRPSSLVVYSMARLPLCIASFAQDIAITAVCRAHSIQAMPLLLLHASSWPTLVFGSRTFSNTLEATLSALSLAWYARATAAERPPLAQARALGKWRDASILGGLLALGCWVRFTFVLLWTPLCLALGRHLVGTATHPSACGREIATARQRMAATLCRQGLAVVSAALMMAAVLLAVDCHTYGGQCTRAPWRCVPALNALWYNSSPVRLSGHGLHSRLTHALINLPLLGGPLAFAALLHLRASCSATYQYQSRLAASLARLVVSSAPRRARAVGDAASPPPQAPQARQPPNPERGVPASDDMVAAHRTLATTAWPPHIEHLLLATVLLPLAALSTMPHQEPRFLLPLLLPLLLLCGHRVVQSRGQTLVWIAYHAILTVFYSVAHQAGVTRAIAHLQAHGCAAATHSIHTHLGPDHRSAVGMHTPPAGYNASPSVALFYHTYMPPPSLLAAGVPPVACNARGAAPCERNNVVIEDLRSSGPEALVQRVQAIMRQQARSKTQVAEVSHGRLRPQGRQLVLAPAVCAVLPIGLVPSIRRHLEPSASTLSRRQSRRWRPWRWRRWWYAMSGWRARVQMTSEATFWPHWSGEDPPQTLRDASLVIMAFRKLRS